MTQATAAFVGLLATSQTEVVGACFPDLFHPMARKDVRLALSDAPDEGPVRFTAPLVSLAGDVHFTDVTAHAVEPGVGTICVLVTNETNSSRATFVLSDLDARILEGLAAGDSTVRLAMRLFLSRQGVDYHVGSMLKKLAVPNRAALVSKAYAMGVLNRWNWPPRVSPEYVA
ncbi:MAG TPA: LuxR C-terminal-related transcriptional regulator [Amycolatopsis sp.]|uniref:LuxR C-terminal-related transcriptional regulator n=1 Tax=Amycolatopsis sp. TaxID=37632 RepID=UPI002B466C98|nr:LuxR C-terminal-related transcriptional regulator [Amycolatopsis sp.]HKS47162.1 LuxR C-terminal-related transcriptional regulator [Amycolatopsis sp.]